MLSIVVVVVQKKYGIFVRAFEYYWAFCVFSLSQSGEGEIDDNSRAEQQFFDRYSAEKKQFQLSLNLIFSNLNHRDEEEHMSSQMMMKKGKKKKK